MFTIQYQAIGSYIVFSRKNTLRAAKREAKNLWYYAGWLNIQIVTPEGKILQVYGGNK
jgi:hypothetical protein